MRTESSVAVVGGGPAGVAAAIAAARGGADVVLIERHGCLGGMATAGLLGFLGPLDSAARSQADWSRFRLDRQGAPYPPELSVGGRIVKGIAEEIVEELRRRGAAEVPTFGYIPVNGEALKLLLEELAHKAGVEIVYGAAPHSAAAEDGRIALSVAAKGGGFELKARRVVDASGDGDVAAALGAPFAQGRPSDGQCQGVTLVFRLGGVATDPLDFLPDSELYALIRRRAAEAFTNKEISFHPRGVGCVSPVPGMPGVITVNHQHTYGVDGTRAEAVTRALLNGRRQVAELVGFFKRHVPGCGGAFLLDTGYQLGVRETRRILGDYVLTGEDVVKGAKFQDGVCRFSYPFDIHLGGDNDIEGNCPPPGDWYDIPYRCLLPRGVENLLVAGRCISGTHEAMSSYRLMSCCMAMGQAAGTAAALSLRHGVAPRSLPPDDLRRRLAADNAVV